MTADSGTESGEFLPLRRAFIAWIPATGTMQSDKNGVEFGYVIIVVRRVEALDCSVHEPPHLVHSSQTIITREIGKSPVSQASAVSVSTGGIRTE